MEESEEKPMRFTDVAASLLHRLIDPEEVAPLAHFFKEYMLISDESFNEIEELMKDKRNVEALLKLVKSATDKSSDNWEVALNNQDIPVHHEMLQLLKLALKPLHNTLLGKILNNWEYLEGSIDSIIEVLALNIEREDTNWKMMQVLLHLVNYQDCKHTGYSDATQAILHDILIDQSADLDYSLDDTNFPDNDFPYKMEGCGEHIKL